jgi:hypothetical protein
LTVPKIQQHFSVRHIDVVLLTIFLSIATMTLAVLNMLKFGQGLMSKLDSASTLPDRDEVYAFEVRNNV